MTSPRNAERPATVLCVVHACRVAEPTVRDTEKSGDVPKPE